MLPAWLLAENRRIVGSRTKIKNSAFVGTRGDGSEYLLSSGQNPEVLSFIVCKSCNTGWMKRCEDAVCGFLKAMMCGERRDLSLPEQFSFSMWLLKTAMVLDADGRSESRFFTKEQRHTMKENYGKALSTRPPFPKGMYAWIGTYNGTTSIAVEGHTFTWLSDGPASVLIRAYTLTVVFGQVVGQLLVASIPIEGDGIDTLRSPKVNLAQRLLYQVFPPRPVAVAWPPHQKLNDTAPTLDDIVLRWGGSGGLSGSH